MTGDRWMLPNPLIPKFFDSLEKNTIRSPGQTACRHHFLQDRNHFSELHAKFSRIGLKNECEKGACRLEIKNDIPPLFANNAIAITIIHESISWMSSCDRRDSVFPGFFAGYPSIPVVVPPRQNAIDTDRTVIGLR